MTDSTNVQTSKSPIGKPDAATAEVQAIEVTPDKKVVWALRSWEAPTDLGPATTIQVLPR